MAQTYYQYRAYIKDRFNINTKPKAFLVVRTFTIRRDLLTTSNSQFNVSEIPSNVNEGDIFVLYEPNGTVMYYGIITALEDYSITCSQIQSFYKGQWIYDTHSTTSLEGEIAYLLAKYSDGFQKGSTYQDMLQYQEKAPIYIKTSGTTAISLETKEDNEVIDFEEFIYDLYKKYNLVFDFEIPANEWTIGAANGGSVTIRKASDSVVKIGNNAECILDMTPTTEIEQVNKLIVYSSNGTYRTTFVATTTDGIVEEPTSIVGRYGVINTEVVYSDDDINVIKEANIKEDMFNHKVEFTLLLDNNLYDFWSWELGQKLQIYQDGKFFESIFTGYEISKGDNVNPKEVKVVCGLVRTKLTSLLKVRGVLS